MKPERLAGETKVQARRRQDLRLSLDSRAGTAPRIGIAPWSMGIAESTGDGGLKGA